MNEARRSADARASFEASERSISDADAERIARRVVEILREGGDAPMLDATEVARRTGRSREWVYRHAEELGGRRLGDGPRPRLAFDPSCVERAFAGLASRRTEGRDSAPAKGSRRRLLRKKAGEDEFLPVRGSRPA
jgi:hypothetical protein